MSGPPINPSNPSNAMLLSAINRLFERVDELEATVRSGFADLHKANTHTAQLVAAASQDTTDVAKQMLRHLNDHQQHVA